MAFNVTVHGRTIHRSVMLTWFRASESHFGEIFSLQIASSEVHSGPADSRLGGTLHLR